MENNKEIYKLPERWSRTRIGEIGAVSSGGTPFTQNKEFRGDEVTWIVSADLSDYKKKYLSKRKQSIN